MQAAEAAGQSKLEVDDGSSLVEMETWAALTLSVFWVHIECLQLCGNPDWFHTNVKCLSIILYLLTVTVLNQ